MPHGPTDSSDRGCICIVIKVGACTGSVYFGNNFKHSNLSVHKVWISKDELLSSGLNINNWIMLCILCVCHRILNLVIFFAFLSTLTDSHTTVRDTDDCYHIHLYIPDYRQYDTALSFIKA